MRGALLTLFVLLGATGCAVKKVPPVTTYTIRMPAPAQSHRPAPRFETLKLAVANADRTTLTTALYYRRGDRLQPYAYHRWARTPVAMIENALLLTLRREGIARNVLGSASSARSPYLLEISPLAFTQVFDDEGRSRGHLLMEAALIDTAEGKVVRSKLFETWAEAPTPDAEGGVEALGRATAEAAEELAAWLAQR
jgi:ABC-type uncharacterized transport system auxiliary subunit